MRPKAIARSGGGEEGRRVGAKVQKALWIKPVHSDDDTICSRRLDQTMNELDFKVSHTPLMMSEVWALSDTVGVFLNSSDNITDLNTRESIHNMKKFSGNNKSR